jgi:hypothetical protein
MKLELASLDVTTFVVDPFQEPAFGLIAPAAGTGADTIGRDCTYEPVCPASHDTCAY